MSGFSLELLLVVNLLWLHFKGIVIGWNSVSLELALLDSGLGVLLALFGSRMGLRFVFDHSAGLV